MEVTGYETRETSKERSIVLVLMWKRTITWSDLQSNMADGVDFTCVDFFDGVDLEAILDILEADEEMEEESINEVGNVSTKNTLITYYCGDRERKMTQKPEHLNTNV